MIIRKRYSFRTTRLPGAETERQAAVIGTKDSVDLPLTIESSNYLANIVRRAATGDMPRKRVSRLEEYLGDTKRTVWENSWVRLPLEALSEYARNVLRSDLLSDKLNEKSDLRSDADRFRFLQNGTEFLRIPVSYLIKLALADAISDVDIGLVHHTGTEVCSTTS